MISDATAPIPWARRSARWDQLTAGPPVTAGVIAFLARGWPRLTHPGIWAEDGTHFIPDAYTRPWRSVFTPFDGYLQVVPRLLALIIRAFPIAAWPALYTASAVGFGLLAFAAVLSPRLAWLIPSAFARGLLFLVLCLLPDFTEPYGNLANLIFVLPVAALAMSLYEDPRTRRWRVTEIIVLVALGLTSPVLTLLVPNFALRWLRNRSRHSGYLFAAALATAGVQTGIFLTSPRTVPGDGTVRQLSRVTVERWLGGWLVGNRYWGLDWRTASLRELWIALAVALVAVTVAALGMVAISLMLAVLVPLAAATRAYGSVLLVSGDARHFVTPHAALALTLVAVPARAILALCDDGSLRRRPLAAARYVVTGLFAVAVLAAGGLGMSRDFSIGGIRQPDMAALNRCLHSAAPVCEVPSAPRGWRIIIRR